jgi:hypothetical protein
MKITMEITEIIVKIQQPKQKLHSNLLACATLTFKGKEGEYFTISGFTIWKSKYGGYNVEPPQKRNFKYCLFEGSLWRKLKKEIIEQYDYAMIPIVEEKNK